MSDSIVYKHGSSIQDNAFKASGLEDVKALVFDCYGTLIDWEQGFLRGLEPLLEQKTCPDPEKVIETIGKNENRIQNENKSMLYPIVLMNAYHDTSGQLRLHFDPEAAEAFGNSVGSWPAFPDSPEALLRLQELGLKLIILSNVNNDSFALSRQKLEAEGAKFDAVYTAEDIGSYKPDLRNFAYALEHLSRDFGIAQREVLSVANSRLHDIVPANRMGLRTCWINRPNAIMGNKGYSGPKPDYEFGSLAAFADAMQEVKLA